MPRRVVSWESTIERWKSLLKEHRQFIEQDDRKLITGIFRELSAQESINAALNDVTRLQANIIYLKSRYKKRMLDTESHLEKITSQLYMSEATAPSDRRKTKEYINYAIAEDDDYQRLLHDKKSYQALFYTFDDMWQMVDGRGNRLQEISTNVRKEIQADLEVTD